MFVQFAYRATVFAAAAALLVVEIVAGRLLAPYVGMSLYTWTAIIGVMLAGLSLGNWLGGAWADRGAGERAAGVTLALAGLGVIGSLLLLTLLAPALMGRGLGLMAAASLYAAALFFLPAVCLGVITPLLTTLALRHSPHPGHVVGTMQALAAVGSIAGTFASGFWLVQSFGSRAVLTGTGLLLLVLGLPYLRLSRAWAGVVLAAAAGIGGLTWARGGFASPCDRESAHFCIRVVDVSREAGYGEARAMVLDHLLHGINHRQRPDWLLSPYMELMFALAVRHLEAADRPSRPRVFFIGGGAYTLPRAFAARWPGARLTVAELDPLVTRVAQEQLFLDPAGMEIVHGDARPVLEGRPPGSLDIVVGDAFQDVVVPPHLLTREFARSVRRRLAPGGLYLLNVVDLWPRPRLAASVAVTLAAEFPHVAAWAQDTPPVPARVTFVLAAAAGPVPEIPPGLEARGWQAVDLPRAAPATVLDDDLAPVERLVSPLLLTEKGR